MCRVHIALMLKKIEYDILLQSRRRPVSILFYKKTRRVILIHQILWLVDVVWRCRSLQAMRKKLLSGSNRRIHDQYLLRGMAEGTDLKYGQPMRAFCVLALPTTLRYSAMFWGHIFILTISFGQYTFKTWFRPFLFWRYTVIHHSELLA